VGLEKLPISLPELVDAAPSLTGDGSVVLGNRQTTLYVLERSSGRLLHVISNTAAGAEDTAALGAPARPGCPAVQRGRGPSNLGGGGRLPPQLRLAAHPGCCHRHPAQASP
jgi:hypothetical protein